MKTRVYLSALLALAVQVMVTGQTPAQTHKIRMNIMGTQQATEKTPVCAVATPAAQSLEILVKETHVLAATAQQLRDEVRDAELQLLLKQIEVSELSAKIAYEKFDNNKIAIQQLLSHINKDTYTYTRTQGMNAAACYLIKTAIEMREEARAQLTEEARYGDMTNAEEFETLALGKQQEIFELLEKAGADTLPAIVANSPAETNAGDVNNMRLAEALKQAQELRITAQQLKEAAATKQGEEQHVMLAEAKNMEKDYILKQVEASELNAAITYDVFAKNRALIAHLAGNIKNNDALRNRVKNLNEQAERFLKMGIEMREEARAQLTMAATYGDMSNAAEEEAMALNKQQETLATLNKTDMQVALR